MTSGLLGDTDESDQHHPKRKRAGAPSGGQPLLPRNSTGWVSRDRLRARFPAQLIPMSVGGCLHARPTQLNSDLLDAKDLCGSGCQSRSKHQHSSGVSSTRLRPESELPGPMAVRTSWGVPSDASWTVLHPFISATGHGVPVLARATGTGSSGTDWA